MSRTFVPAFPPVNRPEPGLNQAFANGALQAEVTGSGPAIWPLHALLGDAATPPAMAEELAGLLPHAT